MDKIRICYIISKTNKFLGFEWVIDNINKERFELTFISIGCDVNSSLEEFCAARGIPFIRLEYSSKADVPKNILSVYRILKKTKPDLVHCHFFEASIIGLTAAALAGIKKRIYTRHHSDFHHMFAPKGVKFDLYCNKLATHIVAISKNVKDLLINKENVPENKITLIYHGLDLSFFDNITEDRIRIVKDRYNVHHKSPVIGIISRYTKWKGIKYGIEAFKELLKQYPDALLILANANGDDAINIRQQLSDLPSNSYMEIAYEHDNAALFRLFDVFIHTPIDKIAEAFGLIYIEALATGIPSIFTLSGIATEIIRDQENALVVNYKSSSQIYTAMLRLLNEPELRAKLINTGKADINRNFSLATMIRALEDLYSTKIIVK
jgi:glycosyltransferase involved in cell wall biosynthesis